jgi:transcriptional regulator with XRE-family HTH domain
MALRKAKAPQTKSGRIAISRKKLAHSLQHALTDTDTSQAQAARLFGKSRRTIGGWLRGESRVDVESIMQCEKLWRPFLRCLVLLERNPRLVRKHRE